MRRCLMMILLVCTFSAHALDSLRVGNQVLSVGDSAARVKALLGNPVVKPKKAGAGKAGTSRSASHKQTKRGAKGETWQYYRDGRTTIVTIAGGKVVAIEDVAR